MGANNKCVVCGKETNNKTFCSKQCQGIDFKNKQRKCPICGKSTTNKVYCSEKCQWESQRGRDDEKWEIIKCLNCYTEIKKLKTRKNNFYCSRKCKKTYEFNNKLGLFNPENRVLNISDETKQKHSKITKELWKSEEHKKRVKDGQLKKYKELGYWFGTDEESKRKRRKTCLNRYGNEVYGFNIKENRENSEKICLEKYGKHSWEISQKSKGCSKIEKIVENFLVLNKIAFLKQFKIYYDEKKYKYKIFDFFLIDKRILIEVDGDYWHGNPFFFKNPNNTQKNAIENDIFKNNLAEKNNYKLLRYWENEIYLDGFECKLINDIKNEK
jgi:endogenous inhibitor of DNA gyrase (YacG/DUF329 family)/very-short-patch-repair endonuclease